MINSNEINISEFFLIGPSDRKIIHYRMIWW